MGSRLESSRQTRTPEARARDDHLEGWCCGLPLSLPFCLSCCRPRPCLSAQDDIAIMSASSSQYVGFSLTDELAEATNELLNLGGRQLGKASDLTPIATPLLTPSPLNLPPGGGGTATLSSLLGISQGSKLVVIHDDDDNDGSPAKYDSNRVATPSSDAEAFDTDDHLPASQLNRLVAPVSANSAYRREAASSPRLRSEKDRARPSDDPHDLSEEASPRVGHTPAFFIESFPDAGQDSPVLGASTSENRLDMVRLPTSLQTFLAERAQPSLGTVGDVQVVVKLHGNGRLEREAQDQTKAEQKSEAPLPAITRSEHYSAHHDDGDCSSLLSLAATALTSSSQASSKARRRLVRRQSAGSTSMGNDNLDTLDNVPFARDVQIRGFTSVGEKSRGFVCYDVRVVTIRGTTISILRRFSSFCQLRQSLLIERPLHASLMPRLPPRRTGLFQKYASHHLEKRRRALQKWLAVVMLDSRWATTKSLREWVIGSCDEM